VCFKTSGFFTYERKSYKAERPNATFAIQIINAKKVVFTKTLLQIEQDSTSTLFS
jgi:hypothetical protein